MDNMLFSRLIHSVVLYVSIFGILKMLFEWLNGKPSKMLDFILKPIAGVPFNKCERKVSNILRWSLDWFFWFSVWAVAYHTIKSTEFLSRDEYLLAPKDALLLWGRYALVLSVALAGILFSATTRKIIGDMRVLRNGNNR